MDDEKIYTKLDEIASDVNQIKITQAVHTAQMEEHMRRTHLIETRQERFEGQVDSDFKALDKRITPVIKHVDRMSGAWKLVLAIATILGIAVAIMRLYG